MNSPVKVFLGMRSPLSCEKPKKPESLQSCVEVKFSAESSILRNLLPGDIGFSVKEREKTLIPFRHKNDDMSGVYNWGLLPDTEGSGRP